jgi:predicted nucleic acid-binding protein
VRVVADTGPLHYLVLIGQIDVLPRLFPGIVISETVRAELGRSATPAVVRAWMSSPPPWLSVVGPSADVTAMPAALDDGERATIALATAIQADLLLMDDRAGVAAARSLGFAVTGTLGILDRAARRGLLDLPAAFVALKATNFHSRQDLLDILLAAWRNDMSR